MGAHATGGHGGGGGTGGGEAGAAPLILGVSGLRGIVGESLTPEVAVRYAATIGTWLREKDESPMVLVARDGRLHGESLAAAVQAGLSGVGVGSVDCGVTSTPGLAFHVDAMSASAGIMVTASHNPQQWNGLKVISARDEDGSATRACAPVASLAAALVDRFRSGVVRWRGPGEQGALESAGRVSRAFGHHEMFVARQTVAAMGGRSYRVVLDSVNGGGAAGAERLMRALSCDAVQLAGNDSGVFPHTPEPTAENLSGSGGLCDAVPGLAADIGFAQDPDADRLAIVDEVGRYIGEEYTPVLAAWSLLAAREGASGGRPVVCVNLSTSRMMDDLAAKFGAEVVRTAVGEANVVEAMKRLAREGREVVMGGEGNGGVIWPEVCFVRDSLSGMALTLSLMARTGKTVSELVSSIDAMASSGRGYAIVKRKVDIPTKEAAGPAVEAVAKAYADQRIDLQDGVRVDWVEAPEGGGAAWLHVRASNTEPIMRLIAEAGTAAQAGAILDDAARVIEGG